MNDSYDLEVFVDPICPYCWITSRWVENVRQLRGYRVRWRSIALKMINDDEGATEERLAFRRAGLAGLRVLDAVRQRHGNEAVGDLYTAIGNQYHVAQRRDELIADVRAYYTSCLVDAGFDHADADDLAEHVDDDSHDAGIRADGELGLERTGPDVGTPILTFAPDTDTSRSLFGPVISKAPRGDEALRLWGAVEILASSGVAEIKRSLRDPLDFT